MRVSRSRNVVENDNTPDAETKLFIEHEMTCVNKNCSNYNTVVKTIRNQLPIG